MIRKATFLWKRTSIEISGLKLNISEFYLVLTEGLQALDVPGAL